MMKSPSHHHTDSDNDSIGFAAPTVAVAEVHVVKDTVSIQEAQDRVRKNRLRAVTISLVSFVAVMALLVTLSHHVNHDKHNKVQSTKVVIVEPPSPTSNNRPHNCVTPFGTTIGTAFGVASYSNCNGDYTSNINNVVLVKIDPFNKSSAEKRVFTGMKWQCVEYARRFLMRAYRLAFGSVEGASDIFKLRFVHSIINTSKLYDFVAYKNGATATLPQIGDLIIYPVQPGGFPFGHVTVVVNVTATAVHIAEQNWDSAFWAHADKGYSRALRLSQYAGKYLVSDPGNYTIDGWKRIETKNGEKHY